MEKLIIPQDKLPWYKDADATRIAVGVGYLVVLVSIMVFVMLTWRDVPDDAKAVILPIVGAITGAAGDLLELRCVMNCVDIVNQEFLIHGSNFSVHYTR